MPPARWAVRPGRAARRLESMAGIFDKVSAFARSPQGKKLLKQAQDAAKDPKNRAKIQELGEKIKDPKNRAKVQELGNKLKDAAKQGGRSGETQPRPDTGSRPPAAPDTHPDPEAPTPKAP
jgi:hypothetical protein